MHDSADGPRASVADIGLFRTNLRRIAGYPHLSAYLARMLPLPRIRNAVNFDHIKAG